MIQTPIVRRDADSRAYQEQLTELWGDVASWLGTHSLEILVGVTFGVAIVFVLLGLRSLGVRICHTKREGADMRRTIGRALAKTHLWFMIAVAAQLIASHAHAPGDAIPVHRRVRPSGGDLGAGAHSRRHRASRPSQWAA
jgi:hypothetical protein